MSIAHRRLQITLIVFAGFLALQSVSILISELLRPVIIFPPDAAASTNAEERHTAATTAAYVGLFRGDLWADAALTYSNLLQIDNRADMNVESRTKIEAARATAERALALSPHDSRVWLLLAALDLQTNAEDGKIAEALRMSYFTGQNELTLLPMRLRLSVRLETMDQQLEELFRQDIVAIVKRAPSLKFAISAAYKAALPQHQRLIESFLFESDPELLAAIRSGSGR